ncbi:uncharacterized protein G2W53_016371 [Senna tora]|uniref:Uncharacterized protein n=1 Tax=Senna tora TaxID=362788 RepID=A0A834TPS7_9FABA|nr:uncharacterized protein G2W53_016371 [Senna tora]
MVNCGCDTLECLSAFIRPYDALTLCTSCPVTYRGWSRLVGGEILLVILPYMLLLIQELVSWTFLMNSWRLLSLSSPSPDFYQVFQGFFSYILGLLHPRSLAFDLLGRQVHFLPHAAVLVSVVAVNLFSGHICKGCHESWLYQSVLVPVRNCYESELPCLWLLCDELRRTQISPSANSDNTIIF